MIFNVPIMKMPSKKHFFYRFVCQNNSAKILGKTSNGVCNTVYFRLGIDLMRITPPVTAEGYDGSHHTRCAECGEPVSMESETVRVVSLSTMEIPVSELVGWLVVLGFKGGPSDPGTKILQEY